jgi:4-hydroxy-tetrahydrodipicolinate synthase
MITHTDLEGIIPAIIIPMRQDLSIDYEALETYLKWVVAQKPVGIAVNVDTGEGPYLTPDERSEVIRLTHKVANGRCYVVAGIGGPSTPFAIGNARAARDAGADALLIFPVAAFGSEPLDSRVMVDYHKAIADAAGLPLIIFQLGPVFGGMDYPMEALAATLELEEIIGLKDASFDAQRFVLTRDAVQRAGHPVCLLTGNDNFMLESLLLGAKGALLGYGATAVSLLVELLNAVRGKDFVLAAAMQPRVQGFCDEYIYRHPFGDYRARSKVALVHMGLLTPEQTFVRPPFRSLWEDDKDFAHTMVQKYGLLNVVSHVKENA